MLVFSANCEANAGHFSPILDPSAYRFENARVSSEKLCSRVAKIWLFGPHSARLQNSRFFLKISKEIGKAWRKSLTGAKRASSLIPDLLFDCSRVFEYAKIRTVLQSTQRMLFDPTKTFCFFYIYFIAKILCCLGIRTEEIQFGYPRLLW